MDIVEHKYDWMRLGEALEQRPHSAVAPIALMLVPHAAFLRKRRQRGKDRGQLGPYVGPKISEANGVDPAEVLVERIDERPEREILLQLGSTPR